MLDLRIPQVVILALEPTYSSTTHLSLSFSCFTKVLSDWT